jgi:uncharacterized membrane-anchored protein
VSKIVITAMGEATSDYMNAVLGGTIGVPIMLIVLCVALKLQFSQDRYVAWRYWFVVVAIAVFGTSAADGLHVVFGIAYPVSTALCAVVLACVFTAWYRSEGTLSIHSITSQQREAFYWATVFATFALGTALGDYTATSLNLGYLDSAILFTVVIFIPALAHWRLGLNGIAAFWLSYVVTRPLGASYADYISKPEKLSGINFGDGPTAAVFALAVLVLVIYLAVARPDIQRPRNTPPARRHAATAGPGSRRAEPEPDLE